MLGYSGMINWNISIFNQMSQICIEYVSHIGLGDERFGLPYMDLDINPDLAF